MSVCQSCGACCSYFRVSFYWREAEAADSPHPVPVELCQDLSPTYRNMKGTTDKRHRRCVALDGKVGSCVTCTIYENRPTPCRAFPASWENGERNPRCDEARAANGLAPLKRPVLKEADTNLRCTDLPEAHPFDKSHPAGDIPSLEHPASI